MSCMDKQNTAYAPVPNYGGQSRTFDPSSGTDNQLNNLNTTLPLLNTEVLLLNCQWSKKKSHGTAPFTYVFAVHKRSSWLLSLIKYNFIKRVHVQQFQTVLRYIHGI